MICVGGMLCTVTFYANKKSHNLLLFCVVSEKVAEMTMSVAKKVWWLYG